MPTLLWTNYDYDCIIIVAVFSWTIVLFHYCTVLFMLMLMMMLIKLYIISYIISLFHSLHILSYSASPWTSAFPLISTLRIFPNHVSITYSRYATYVTPSRTTRRKPSPARSSGHGLTMQTLYWLARHPKTSTGCSTSRTHWRGLL